MSTEAEESGEGRGVRKPTLRDVARRLGLSVTTISKVINNHDDISEETKKQVMDAVRKMGYTPNFMASNLRRKHGSLVGLVLSDISQPFFSEVIHGYQSVLDEAGYQSLIFNTYEDSEKELELLRQVATLNVAGIIIDIAQYPEKSIAYLRGMGIPFVLSNRYVDREADCYVVADNVEAGYRAVGHLLERKPVSPVLCLNGPDSISPTTDRFEGYVRALASAGIPYRDEWVFDNHFGLEDGYATGVRICRGFNPPFSVFCSTDQIAIGFMRAVKEAGFSIPGDVSVIGVDGVAVSEYITPALTTMSLPKETMGRRSAGMLLSLMEKGEVDHPREFLPPVLTVRGTT